MPQYRPGDDQPPTTARDHRRDAPRPSRRPHRPPCRHPSKRRRSRAPPKREPPPKAAPPDADDVFYYPDGPADPRRPKGPGRCRPSTRGWRSRPARPGRGGCGARTSPGRQWGTVREDYSADGNAWDYFPFDHANARAYRWGEDGLGGICDRFGFLNFAVALWNGKDPILKERLFGLTNGEGNHGEDVKEYWWAIDGTPTHSWMQWLYRYPQAEYPYAQLRDGERRARPGPARVRTRRHRRAGRQPLLRRDVSYAKAAAEDVCIRITVTNHGPEAAPIDVLPTIWLRNTWAWGRDGRAAARCSRSCRPR